MKRMQGFTLLELVMVMMIGVILLTIAAPAFQTVIQTNRMASQANDFVSSLQFARSEAVKRGSQVAVCKSADPFAADPGCSSSSAWHDGWITFEDSDGNGTKDAGEALLRVHEGFASNDTLTAGATFQNRIRFNSQGFNADYSEGNLIICNNQGNAQARVIEIKIMGRIGVVNYNSQTNGTTIACS